MWEGNNNNNVCVYMCMCMCVCVYVYVHVFVCVCRLATKQRSVLRFLTELYLSGVFRESTVIVNLLKRLVCVWCVMCDVWCVMCDVWCVMYDVWCVMCDVCACVNVCDMCMYFDDS